MIVSLIATLLLIIIFYILEIGYVESEIDTGISYKDKKLINLYILKFLFPHNRNYPKQIARITLIFQLIAITTCVFFVIISIIFSLFYGLTALGLVAGIICIFKTISFLVIKIVGYKYSNPNNRKKRWM